MKEKIIKLNDALNWITDREKNPQIRGVRKAELGEVKRSLIRMSVTSKIDVKELSNKSIASRRKNLEVYYTHIIPVIEKLQKEGKITGYAITNALNAMGEMTVRGKAFRPPQVHRLMELQKERDTQMDLID